MIETRQFGPVEYTDDSVLELPLGLAGFDQNRRWVLIERAESAPVLFLQSLDDPALSFVTLPIHSVVAGYRIDLDPEARQTLGVPESAEPQEVLCLAIVTLPGEGEPTVNLRAPLVIYRPTRRACQLIQFDSAWSFRHPLEVAGC